MVRRLLVGMLALLTVTVGLAVTGGSAGAFSDYHGTVFVDCTSVSLPLTFVADRDNTGRGVEAISIQVIDGNGFVLLDRGVSVTLGPVTTGLGTFRFPAPSKNPLTVKLTSIAGNGLPAKVAFTLTTTCDALSTSFVRSAFQDFVGRPPTPAELLGNVVAISGGVQARAEIVTRLAATSEHLGRLVDALYLDTLGRHGDAGGIDYWVGRLQSGSITLSRASASFYASNEYFRGLGGGTNESWVRDLYAKLLQRTPEAGGVTYWSGQAAHGRTGVALSFFQAPESRRTRVIALYTQLLGRAPSAGELATASAGLLTGSDTTLAISLASSDEYDRRAALRFP